MPPTKSVHGSLSGATLFNGRYIQFINPSCIHSRHQEVICLAMRTQNKKALAGTCSMQPMSACEWTITKQAADT